MEESKVDVFISYATRNKEVADGIYKTLQGAGIKCWVSHIDLIPGQNYTTEIAKVMNQCRVVILIFSKEASESEWVQVEANMAFSDKKVIMPYKIDDTNITECEKFRPLLQLAHWTDSSHDWEDKLPDLAKAVRRTLALPPIEIAKPNIERSTPAKRGEKREQPKEEKKGGGAAVKVAIAAVVVAAAVGGFLFMGGGDSAESSVAAPAAVVEQSTPVAKPQTSEPTVKAEPKAVEQSPKSTPEPAAAPTMAQSSQSGATMASKSKKSSVVANRSAAVASIYNKGMAAYEAGRYTEAIGYFEQAGGSGYLEACEMLSQIYRDGVAGIAKNPMASESWAEKANKLR